VPQADMVFCEFVPIRVRPRASPLFRTPLLLSNAEG
jgi:hypothetical protein